MDLRVTIYLTGGSLEDFGLGSLGQAEHIDCSVNRGLGGLDRIILVVDWRSRACHVENFINLNIEWESNVVPEYLEAWIGQKVSNVGFGSGEEIVKAQNFVAVFEQYFTEMRTKEACSTSYQNYF